MKPVKEEPFTLIARPRVGQLVKFGHQVGLNYVSGSSYLVPVARLAAGKAAKPAAKKK